MRNRVLAVVVLLLATLVPSASWASTGAAEPPVATEPPTIIGQPVYDDPADAHRGTWVPETGLTFSYQWLRGGQEIAGATKWLYRPVLADLGKHLRVRVTATDESGQTGVSTSEPKEVRKNQLRNTTRPSLSGTKRYTHDAHGRPRPLGPQPGRGVVPLAARREADQGRDVEEVPALVGGRRPPGAGPGVRAQGRLQDRPGHARWRRA